MYLAETISATEDRGDSHGRVLGTAPQRDFRKEELLQTYNYMGIHRDGALLHDFTSTCKLMK